MKTLSKATVLIASAALTLMPAFAMARDGADDNATSSPRPSSSATPKVESDSHSGSTG
jgi:hypothetical protein